ncbi:hypothetical protein GTA62_20535 [Roseobacter sp. HKCCD9010]|uniref:tripartite tricarboxylate transporter TctB family protein n=1 Tax=unclassified Roseobacter TaxID=196798 RepID=UPI00149245FE|nr:MULTISPECIES: tripartite tricarboxylate transporter TctB family protein [unclassified Roseobacter]MBF9052383.1 hypothetical protein [Rhodobacterales bacterium HKCCD4356]NNV13712.1 hypothetical protein [Roseobacter sp. HKCCD7357]NNV18550.1 hypothetical protein [Roseobacter sp. HKCCD8768]NNV28001.1 hypothetical protein [Roseobacter sp. HKCCD8192]NNV32301.1 hypothetical protein [Roseobacter sp. HKCCD9061]
MQNRALQADVLLALVMLIISAVLFYGGWQLPASRWEPMGPGGMPLITASALAGLSLILLARVLLKHRSAETADQTRASSLAEGRLPKVLACVAVSFVYLLLLALEILPFMVATVAYIIAYGLIDGGRGRRDLMVLVATALALGIGVSLILTEILIVQLPGA